MKDEEMAEEYRKALKQRLIDEDDFERLEMFDENVEQAFLAGLKARLQWHYVKDGKYPTDDKKVLCILGDFENDNLEVGYYSQVEGDSKRWRFENYDLPDDSEEGWGVSAWKEIVLPKESE